MIVKSCLIRSGSEQHCILENKKSIILWETANDQMGDFWKTKFLVLRFGYAKGGASYSMDDYLYMNLFGKAEKELFGAR